MTPEQTKSAYQRVCEQECEWCAKGNLPTVSGDTVHKVYSMESSAPLWQRDGSVKGMSQYFPCTAPSKEAFMERQAAQIAAMQAALARAPHGGDCSDLCVCPGCGGTDPNCRICAGYRPDCDCYLSALSDDVERGKELLDKERQLTTAWEADSARQDECYKSGYNDGIQAESQPQAESQSNASRTTTR